MSSVYQKENVIFLRLSRNLYKTIKHPYQIILHLPSHFFTSLCSVTPFCLVSSFMMFLSQSATVFLSLLTILSQSATTISTTIVVEVFFWLKVPNVRKTKSILPIPDKGSLSCIEMWQKEQLVAQWEMDAHRRTLITNSSLY